MTFGWCVSVQCSAASTSPASATTLKSPSSSKSSRRPLRTIVWSSTSRIRIGSEAGSATVARI